MYYRVKGGIRNFMKIKKNDIIDSLALALEQEIKTVSKIQEHENLSNYGLTSLNGIQLLVLLEEKYNIEFSDDDLNIENYQTVCKVLKLVNNYLNYNSKTDV